MECNDNRGRIALARRYYLHLSSGAPIVASDMGRVIEGMEQMDAEIARLRRALCEYQIKYWTIQYKLSLFSIEGDA